MRSGDLAGVHPDVVALGSFEQCLILFGVAPDKYFVVLYPKEFPLAHLLFFALGLAPFGYEKFQFIGLFGLGDGVVDIFVKAFFALEILFFDVNVFCLVLGTFGKVEVVVAKTIDLDISGQGDRHLVALKIPRFELGIVGFDLVKIGKDEVAVSAVGSRLCLKFLGTGEFVDLFLQLGYLFGCLGKFLLLYLGKALLLNGVISLFQDGIDIRDIIIVMLLVGVVGGQHPTGDGEQFYTGTHHTE